MQNPSGESDYADVTILDILPKVGRAYVTRGVKGYHAVGETNCLLRMDCVLGGISHASSDRQQLISTVLETFSFCFLASHPPNSAWG